MEEFPSNSRKNREVAEREPKLERVTRGEVIRRKKPLGRQFTEFFAGNARSAGSYVFLDVLLPALRDMIADAATFGAERMIYGDTRGGGRRSGVRTPGGIGHTPYHRMGASASRYDRPDPRMTQRARATHDFSEIILPTRHEAADVLDKMFELCTKYEQVTVSELYDLVGIPPAYTDDKYGWIDLNGADIRRIREGYLLDLPRPEPLG